MKTINHILFSSLFTLAILGHFSQDIAVYYDHLNNIRENTSIIIESQNKESEENSFEEECMFIGQTNSLKIKNSAKKLNMVYFRSATSGLVFPIWLPPKIS